METIIQAGHKRLRIQSLPVTTNPKTRESRLFTSMGQHIVKSGQAISRSYVMYKPHAVFITLGLAFTLGAAVPFGRYAVLLATGTGGQHLQSIVLGATSLVGALLSFALLVLADLQRTNRVLLEETLERLKDVQYGTTAAPAGSAAAENRRSSGGNEPGPVDRAGPLGQGRSTGSADLPAAV
jgi:hypothetical protein